MVEFAYCAFRGRRNRNIADCAGFRREGQLMIWEWSFLIAMAIGAVAGALIVAVHFLDHNPGEQRKRRWKK